MRLIQKFTRATSSAAVLSVLLVVWLCLPACGAPVGPDTAALAVQGWLKGNAKPLNVALGAKVLKTQPYADSAGTNDYYIVQLSPSGFVVVPADDLVEPIIAFAAEGTFGAAPHDCLADLVRGDVPNRLLRARSLAGKSLAGAPLEANARWQQLLQSAAGEKHLSSISKVRVAPFVLSRWNQSTAPDGPACYNYYTPPHDSGDANNYVCGCVATAMAQLMRYHQHPTDGVGTAQDWIFVDYIPYLRGKRGGDGQGGPYAWGSMPYVPTNAPAAQRAAIGALTADAGVSVNMAYTGHGSYAQVSEARNALLDTFFYANAIFGQNGGSTIGSGLYGMINPNLDARLPVMLEIWGVIDGKNEGHAIICDGYGYDSSTPYHHLNMGWGGAEDAWYNLPTIDSSPGPFTNIAGCVYNVYPSGSGEIISGRVLDQSGNAVANATVMAFPTIGGLYTDTTDNNGIYALTHVPAANIYTVMAMKSGYATVTTSCGTGYSANNQPAGGNVWALDITLPLLTLPPTTILSEDFESPPLTNRGWTIADANPNGTAAYWTNVASTFGTGGTHGGSYKGYCAGMGYGGNSTAPTYQAYMRAQMSHSLNLSNYYSATLNFWSLVPSLAALCTNRVLLDGTVIWSSTSVVGSWTLTTLDLTPYVGSNHTLQFEFVSGLNTPREGWYLDDIVVTGIPAAANDYCASAITLTGGTAYTMTNTYATSANDPAPDCQPGFGKGVWFKYTPTGDGPVLVSTCGSSFDTVLAVYRGTCGNLTQVACCDNAGPGCSASQASTVFTASATTNYYILAGGYQGASGTLQVLAQLANNQCAGAIALSAGSTYTMSTKDASSSADEATSCAYGAGKGVWFTFTPYTNGIVTFNTCGSSFSTAVQAYTGACGALTPVPNGCGRDGYQCGGNGSFLQFPGNAGTTYRFLVLGNSYSSGNLMVKADIRPAVTVTINSLPALDVYIDQYPVDSAALGGGDVPFTRTYAAGTSISLTAPLTEGPYEVKRWQVNGTNYSNTTRMYAFLNTNTTVTAIYAPTNDLCLSARWLSADMPYQISTAGATSSGDQPPVCSGTISNSIWFKYVSSYDCAVAVSTCGSDFDTCLQVWTGTCASPVILACNDDSTECSGTLQSYCPFGATAGTTYLIQAGGYNGATGNLQIVVSRLPAIINAQPGGATVNAGSSTTLSVSAFGAAPLGYIWQRGGMTLTGLTNSSISLTNIDPGLAGDYRVIITNYIGSVTSAIATLTVLPALADALDNATLTWTTGGGSGWYRRTSISHDGSDSATCTSTGSPWLQTSVSGPCTVSFYWVYPANLMTTDYLGFFMDGVQQAGLKSLFGSWSHRTCYVPAGSHTLSWAYVPMSRSYGPAGVDQVTYTAGPTAAFVGTPPLPQQVTAGAGATFTVGASGTPPFTYQWQFNGVDLANATNSSLALTNIQPSQAGPYQVVISNAYGPAFTSASAALTVTTIPIPLAIDYAGPAWASFGDGSWFGQIGLTHDGIDAAQSSPIDDMETCDLTATLLGPGNLSFWWKVSCYTNRDRLRFMLNGTMQTNISGESGWRQQTVAIPAGQQNVAWSYYKGRSAGHAQDTAWLDQITYDGPPSLMLHPLSAEQGMLTWPASLSGFTVQYATNPVPGALWQNAPGVPSVSGDDWMLTNTLTAPRQFYRLKK